MGLRETAASDFQAIVEDSAGGFGWPITLRSPSGATASLVGLTTDIGVTVDPGTGMQVVGRRASVSLSLRSLATAGIGIPIQVSSESRRPWTVEFANASGVVSRWKVMETMPDHALDAITCIVESYR